MVSVAVTCPDTLNVVISLQYIDIVAMGDRVDEQPSGLSFETQAYKYIMLLGFIGEDDEIGQNVLGDRGGIAIVVEYMDFYRVNLTYVKWCCWALIVSARA